MGFDNRTLPKSLKEKCTHKLFFPLLPLLTACALSTTCSALTTNTPLLPRVVAVAALFWVRSRGDREGTSRALCWNCGHFWMCSFLAALAYAHKPHKLIGFSMMLIRILLFYKLLKAPTQDLFDMFAGPPQFQAPVLKTALWVHFAFCDLPH